jgi:hypothetical protein
MPRCTPRRAVPVVDATFDHMREVSGLPTASYIRGQGSANYSRFMTAIVHPGHQPSSFAIPGKPTARYAVVLRVRGGYVADGIKTVKRKGIVFDVAKRELIKASNGSRHPLPPAKYYDANASAPQLIALDKAVASINGTKYAITNSLHSVAIVDIASGGVIRKHRFSQGECLPLPIALTARAAWVQSCRSTYRWDLRTGKVRVLYRSPGGVGGGRDGLMANPSAGLYSAIWTQSVVVRSMTTGKLV